MVCIDSWSNSPTLNGPAGAHKRKQRPCCKTLSPSLVKYAGPAVQHSALLGIVKIKNLKKMFQEY
jgi:hypothetical protein